MANINNNYKALVQESNATAKSQLNPSSNSDIAQRAAAYKAKEAQDEANYQIIEDAANDDSVSGWTVAKEIIETTLAGTAGVVQAFSQSKGTSSSSTQTPRKADTSSKSGIDAAIDNFKADPTAEGKANLIEQIGYTEAHIVDLNKSITDTQTRLDEISGGVLNEIQQQAGVALAAKAEADGAFQKADDAIKSINDNIAAIVNDLSENTTKQGEVQKSEDRAIEYKNANGEIVKISLNEKANAETTLAQVLGDYNTRVGNRAQLDQGLASANALPDEVVDPSGAKNDDGTPKMVPNPEKPTEVNNAKQAIAENEDKIKELAEQMDIEKADIADLNRQYVAAKAAVAAADEDINKLGDQLREYVDEGRILGKSKIRNENDGKDAAAVLANNVDLLKNLNEIGEDAEKMKSYADKAIADLNNEIKDYNKEIDSCKRSVNRANAALASCPVDDGDVKMRKGKEVNIDGKTYKVDSLDGNNGAVVSDKDGRYNVTYDKDGKMHLTKITDTPAATPKSSGPAVSEDGTKVTVGSKQYVVNGGDYGYYVDSNGKKVDKDDPSATGFKKVGVVPATAGA